MWGYKKIKHKLKKNNDMEFTCSHCGKPIQCSAIIVNQKYFVHTQCEKEFKKAQEENEINNVEDLIEA